MAQQTKLPSNGFSSGGNFGTLTFGGFQCTIPYQSSNNLPILFLASNFTNTSSSMNFSSTATSSLLSSIDCPNDTPSNLTPSQCKLLHLHHKMGHLHMAKIQDLACSGSFGKSSTHLSNCDPPLCKACLHGKQHKSSFTPSNASGIIDACHLEPGDYIWSDQVESTSPGLVSMYRGMPTANKYHAGTLFVNHSSRFLHLTPHISTGSQEAIQAKHHI
jgi:hypothetical protein